MFLDKLIYITMLSVILTILTPRIWICSALIICRLQPKKIFHEDALAFLDLRPVNEWKF